MKGKFNTVKGLKQQNEQWKICDLLAKNSMHIQNP